MLGLTWSLGLLHYLTNMAFAAAPAQSGITSANDLSWADYILNGPNLPSLNPSTTVSSDSNFSSSINLSNLGPIRCFQNPLAPAPPTYLPIKVDDYLEALEKIVVEDDALSILSWTFRPNERKTWSSNRCQIAVGAPFFAARTVSAAFQPVVIAHLGAKFAQVCFQPGRGLGGYVTFGEHQELNVVLGALSPNVVDRATS